MALYKRAKYHPNMVLTSQKSRVLPLNLSLSLYELEVLEFAQQAAH